MLSSRVKISCFRAKTHLVFHWCLYDKFLFVTVVPGDVTLFLDFIMWAYAVIEGADVAVLSLSSKLNIY